MLKRLKELRRAIKLLNKVRNFEPLDEQDKAYIVEIQTWFNAMPPEKQQEALDKAVQWAMKGMR